MWTRRRYSAHCVRLPSAETTMPSGHVVCVRRELVSMLYFASLVIIGFISAVGETLPPVKLNSDPVFIGGVMFSKVFLLSVILVTWLANQGGEGCEDCGMECFSIVPAYSQELWHQLEKPWQCL